jgi:hypothetical protein
MLGYLGQAQGRNVKDDERDLRPAASLTTDKICDQQSAHDGDRCCNGIPQEIHTYAFLCWLPLARLMCARGVSQIPNLEICG